MRLLTRLANLTQLPVTQIVVGTSISLALSIGSVWLLNTMRHVRVSLAFGVLILILFFLSYALPVGTVILAIHHAFHRNYVRRKRLSIILSAYFSMIMVFTGVYFSMANIGDYAYAQTHYSYYNYAGLRSAVGSIKRVNPFQGRPRAFIGIEKSLWSRIGDQIDDKTYMDLVDIEQYRANLATKMPFDKAVAFQRQSVLSVLSDCFHLSVTTIATVGYGNVAPAEWYSKLASSCEALTGMLLIVIALGLLFSNSSTDLKDQPESSSPNDCSSLDGKGKKGKTEYKMEDIRPLYFQMDTLLHTRINYLLVIETIFIVAVATMWKDFPIVLPLCVIGILTTILVTLTNLRLYWRLAWLVRQFKSSSDLFHDYLAMKGIVDPSYKWGPITLRILNIVSSDKSGKVQPRWLDSGWLFTWGLGIIAVVGWIVLAAVSAIFGGDGCTKK